LLSTILKENNIYEKTICNTKLLLKDIEVFTKQVNVVNDSAKIIQPLERFLIKLAVLLGGKVYFAPQAEVIKLGISSFGQTGFCKGLVDSFFKNRDKVKNLGALPKKAFFSQHKQGISFSLQGFYDTGGKDKFSERLVTAAIMHKKLEIEWRPPIFQCCRGKWASRHRTAIEVGLKSYGKHRSK
ncbi:unnamed protein product, partial [marine sediment metagenome]